MNLKQSTSTVVTVVAAVAVISLGLVLAACGSDSSGVASLEGATDEQMAEPGKAASDGALDEEAKVMAFVQCMRDQGFEFKDPVVDSEGNVQKPELAEGFNYDKAALREAWEECGELLEGVTFGYEKRDLSEEVERYLALAALLRDKGFDVDDPTVETLKTWLSDLRVVVDWDDPTAQEAYEEWGGDIEKMIGGGDKGKGGAK